MHWLGAISYSTYLFHWLIFRLLADSWPESALAMLGAVLLALLAGTLGYRLFVQQAERLRHRLNQANRTRRKPLKEHAR